MSEHHANPAISHYGYIKDLNPYPSDNYFGSYLLRFRTAREMWNWYAYVTSNLGHDTQTEAFALFDATIVPWPQPLLWWHRN